MLRIDVKKIHVKDCTCHKKKLL